MIEGQPDIAQQTHQHDAAQRSRGGRVLVRRGIRALVLIVLLVGPSVALESWARRETRLIPYFQTEYRYRLEAKKLMFDNVACPASVSMGTSMTEVSLNAAGIKPYVDRSGDRSFSPIFTFAAPGTRPIAMLGVWRWLEGRACRPKTLFVEVTPVILNMARGEDFERAFMDLRMQLDVDEDRFTKPPYTLRFRAELATWWRSFAYRNREPIVQYLRGRLGVRKVARAVHPIPSDGVLKPTVTDELKGAKLNSLYRSTKGTFDRGEFKFRYTPAYADVVMRIVDEAQAAGTKVILHTPPVPAMFHEFMEMIDAAQPFCELYAAATARADVRWYSEYRIELPNTEFSDWLHLNRGGAERYAERLLSAVAAERFPRDPCLPR